MRISPEPHVVSPWSLAAIPGCGRQRALGLSRCFLPAGSCSRHRANGALPREPRVTLAFQNGCQLCLHLEGLEKSAENRGIA